MSEKTPVSEEVKSFRTPADVKEEFYANPRRALIITTLDCENKAITAYLTNPELLIGSKDVLYEYGHFYDLDADWLIVHVITSQGNSDAGLDTKEAFYEFGNFQVVMFVGVAGSLKEDIPIGSVVISDYVYNGQSAKVTDIETLGRPHALISARELLTAAKGLIHLNEWRSLIRTPIEMEMLSKTNYPCNFPPLAIIKGIVSGEEVVAGDKSKRFAFIRSHFNDCGAVEMEGWGVMSAVRHENASAIIVRGISDMCAGKNYENDKLHQPIAAAHAAAFAFSILSFRSKAPVTQIPVFGGETKKALPPKADESPSNEEPRVEIVFNFEGLKEDWSEEKLNSVIENLKQVLKDDKLTLVRIEDGSIRLVMNVRENDKTVKDLKKLREATASSGVTLLGAMPSESIQEAEIFKEALTAVSTCLLAWERTLSNGKWMERPEQDKIEANFHLNSSSTVLLGEPGSGKSALLSKIASSLLDQGAIIFALKADALSSDIYTEPDLQRELQLSTLPSELILKLAALQPVYVIIDQLDALANQLDLRSERLNVLLNLVRRIGGITNVHILLSTRTFEFNHDVRLRAIEAEGVTLALPPWHEVKERLSEIGINPDIWPEKARDVVRIPQALKIFIDLVDTGRYEPFTTYQAMLEQLWRERIASADDSESLIALASDLAGIMAEEEALWLAASRFDDRLRALNRLEALGFIVRSENNFSVTFSHQTIFDYILARTFVGSVGLLSTYVLQRQDSLFVRAKMWSALNYLREAEAISYEREFLAIWKTEALRRHLRVLLVEFLGQVNQPLEFEKTCMAEVMNTSDLRIFGLKAIGSCSGWFVHFASTAIQDAMSGTDAEVGQALRILAFNWKTEGTRIIRLIKDRWLTQKERDNYSWGVINECDLWNDEVEEIATVILKRSPISIWQVVNIAMTIAIEQPEIAIRLVLAKFDYLLAEAKGKPEPPPPIDGTENEITSWQYNNSRTKKYEDLLNAIEWYDLPSLAEANPAMFLSYLWPWYVEVFSVIININVKKNVTYIYPGQYFLEIEVTSAENQSSLREKPMTTALIIAIEELAEKAPEDFLRWANENTNLEILTVQMLIAHGYKIVADHFASKALDWLLLDYRRFQLGTSHGLRKTTIDLVIASAPHWSKEELVRFQKAVLDYHPPKHSGLREAKQRKFFQDKIRATKKDLLQAIGVERLAPDNRELVASEQRALGNRFDYSIGEVTSGFIGSPMEATAMTKAKDRDIIKIFREIPDNTEWDHPTNWMRGGNIQLSRSFADFARSDPERAIRLIEQFEPTQQERAAGYSLNTMAEDVSNAGRIIDAFNDLHTHGFKTEEFRDSAACAIDKIASKGIDINDDVIDILVEWLSLTSVTVEEESKVGDTEKSSIPNETDSTKRSILWGLGNATVLPSGNFNILSALASILLNKKEEGRDRYFFILDKHFLNERNPNVWKALLMKLYNAGGSTPNVASAFFRKLFARFPEILISQEAVLFLAYAQRWDAELVFELISDWRISDNYFLMQAYGELVGLVALTTFKENWVRAREEILTSGKNEIKIGLAYAAVNLWPSDKLRPYATRTMVALLKRTNKNLVATVMDVFRVIDEFVLDVSTVELLKALADSDTDMSDAPSSFIVDRLQDILPHEAELIATISKRLVTAWRNNLGDISTEISFAATQIADLAITLHRLGGTSRLSGIDLFEAMIEIDAYDTRKILLEIDGRFGIQQTATRRRLARHKRGAKEI